MLGPMSYSQFEYMMNSNFPRKDIEWLKNLMLVNKDRIMRIGTFICPYPTAVFCWAIDQKNIEIIKLCLLSEISPNEYLIHLMKNVARKWKGNAEIFKLLLAYAKEREKLSLEHATIMFGFAVENDHIEVAVLLLEAYPDINFINSQVMTNAVLSAVKTGKFDLLLLLMSYPLGLDYVKQNLKTLLSDKFPLIKNAMNGQSEQQQNFRSTFFKKLLDSQFMAKMTHSKVVLETMELPSELNNLIFGFALRKHLTPENPQALSLEQLKQDIQRPPKIANSARCKLGRRQ